MFGDCGQRYPDVSGLQPSRERREAAFEFLINGPEVDVGDWEEAKKLIGRWTDEEIEKLP